MEDADAALARRLQEEELLISFQQPAARLNFAPNDNDVQQNVRAQLNATGLSSVRVFGAYVLHALIECLLILVVLAKGWGDECDRPLNIWLLMYPLRHFVRLPCRASILAKLRRSAYADDERINIVRERKLLGMTEFYSFVMWVIGQSVLCFLCRLSFLILLWIGTPSSSANQLVNLHLHSCITLSSSLSS